MEHIERALFGQIDSWKRARGLDKIERMRADLGAKRFVFERAIEQLSRDALAHIERAASHAPERREMGDGTETLADVARERANVKAFANVGEDADALAA